MGAAEAQALLALATPGRRFVLTTHVHPDGDGLGSEVALARLLRARGAEARIVNRDPTPPGLAFLDPEGEIEAYDPARHDEVFRAAEVVVMLDNSDLRRLEDLEPIVRASPGRKVCLDHHPDPDPVWDLALLRQDVSCTGVLVLELYQAAGQALDPRTAAALYAALASDTGRFRFANTNAQGFRAAAELVEAGAAPAAVYAELSERLPAGVLRLIGALLAELELRSDGRLVLLRAPAALIARCGAEGEDLSDAINQALRVESSRLAALFRELRDQVVKVSLRSKGALDVNRLARRHGGGGHRNASGVVLSGTIESAVQQLLPDLEALARQRP